MTHIMLDLETWGTRPGCDIRSIGAVVFDPVAGTVGIPCSTCGGGTRQGNVNDGGDCSDCQNARTEPFSEFYIATFQGLKDYGLKRDPETEEWWKLQSEASQSAFDNPTDLKIALLQFNEWLLSQPTDLKIWANDPHFDVSIIEHAYHTIGIDYVWHYRAPRSMKTMLDISGITREEMQAFNVGTTHNALDDAISQAKIVCETYRRLGLQK